MKKYLWLLLIPTICFGWNPGYTYVSKLIGTDIVCNSVTATTTVSAEQLTSTDDASVADDLTVGGNTSLTYGYTDGTINDATITTNTTLTAAMGFVKVNISGGSVTLTLPAVASSAGQIYTVKSTHAHGGNTLTVDGNGAETIDGAATFTGISSQYDSVSFACDGTEWWVY